MYHLVALSGEKDQRKLRKSSIKKLSEPRIIYIEVVIQSTLNKSEDRQEVGRQEVGRQELVDKSAEPERRIPKVKR